MLKKILQYILLLTLLLGGNVLAFAADTNAVIVPPSTAEVSSQCKNLPANMFADRVICGFGAVISTINKSDGMTQMYNRLYKLMFLFIGYQVIRIMMKEDITNWWRKFYHLGIRVMLATLIGFPGKVGVNIPGGIPMQFYLQVKNSLEEISSPYVPGQGKESSGFDGIVQALTGIGNDFWSSEDQLKNSDLQDTSCTANIDLVFQTNSAAGIPTAAQGACIMYQIEAAADNGNDTMVDTWTTKLESGGGYGGWTRAAAVSEVKAADKNKNYTPTKATTLSPAMYKVALERFVAQYDFLLNRVVLWKKTAALNKGSSDAASPSAKASPATGTKAAPRGVWDSGVYLAGLASVMVSKFNVWVHELTWHSFIMGIALGFLWGSIIFAIALFGTAFFLMRFTPIIVVPIMILFYQLMWFTAPLDGQVAKLWGTYKNSILRYAIGPAVFNFLAYFLVALVQGFPKAVMLVAPSTPFLAIVIFLSVFTILIGLFGYKLLSKSYDIAKDLLSLSFDGLLSMVSNFSGFILDLLMKVVGGALGVGAIGAITGGLGIARGAAAVPAALASVGGGSAMAGAAALAGSVTRPGEDGSVGEKKDKENDRDAENAPKGYNQVIEQPKASGGGSAAPNQVQQARPEQGTTKSVYQLSESIDGDKRRLSEMNAVKPQEVIQTEISSLQAKDKQLAAEQKSLSKDPGTDDTRRAQIVAERKKIADNLGDSTAGTGLRGQMAERQGLGNRIATNEGKLKAMTSGDANTVKQGVKEAIAESLPLIESMLARAIAAAALQVSGGQGGQVTTVAATQAAALPAAKTEGETATTDAAPAQNPDTAAVTSQAALSEVVTTTEEPKETAKEKAVKDEAAKEEAPAQETKNDAATNATPSTAPTTASSTAPGDKAEESGDEGGGSAGGNNSDNGDSANKDKPSQADATDAVSAAAAGGAVIAISRVRPPNEAAVAKEKMQAAERRNKHLKDKAQQEKESRANHPVQKFLRAHRRARGLPEEPTKKTKTAWESIRDGASGTMRAGLAGMASLIGSGMNDMTGTSAGHHFRNTVQNKLNKEHAKTDERRAARKALREADPVRQAKNEHGRDWKAIHESNQEVEALRNQDKEASTTRTAAQDIIQYTAPDPASVQFAMTPEKLAEREGADFAEFRMNMRGQSAAAQAQNMTFLKAEHERLLKEKEEWPISIQDAEDGIQQQAARIVKLERTHGPDAPEVKAQEELLKGQQLELLQMQNQHDVDLFNLKSLKEKMNYVATLKPQRNQGRFQDGDEASSRPRRRRAYNKNGAGDSKASNGNTTADSSTSPQTASGADGEAKTEPGTKSKNEPKDEPKDEPRTEKGTQAKSQTGTDVKTEPGEAPSEPSSEDAGLETTELPANRTKSAEDENT